MKMKSFKNVIVLGVLLAIFAGISLVGTAFGDDPSVVITKIENDVKVKKADSTTWEEATLNMALAMGDSVSTGKNSFATLTFSYPKENCFRLDQNTEIVVTELMEGEDIPLKKVNMKMLKGGTWSKLKGMEGQDFQFKLSTPNTIAAISGTALATIVYSDDETYFCACDGIIDIGTPGKSVTIKRCQGTEVKADALPSQPVSDKYIIIEVKYEEDPRYAWCMHCHIPMKKEMMGKPAPMKLSKDAVVQLQERLIELGYNPGPVDGIFGKRTAAALKKFQQDNGLSCTGAMDEKTKELLRL